MRVWRISDIAWKRELQEFGNEIQRGCLVQAWSAAAVLDWVSFVQVEAANISAASAEAA